ncbi:type IV toxin-antitoxin system AbiEi family antitoxin domain-containing protein [Arthrobacter sp. NPDC056727]|uniref:type IV toxin-antitoxin system AbiEi family antitoxin domain-containing protein n=1 Tax=Arthrobacter sp. NPDC056727 TaxID=3345927 RepID=UPI00366AFD52
MAELPRLVLAREHIQLGLTPNMLARRRSSGALVRLRHGVYVDGEQWGSLQPWDQYRLKVQAAAETLAAPTVFAWHSAASIWGVPTVGYHHPVHALTFQNDGGRSRAGVRRHYADTALVQVFRQDGLLVTGRVRTVLDLAAFTSFAEAIVPLDHVLKPDRTRKLPALSKEQLLAGIEGNYTAAAARRITMAIEFADPRSASPGESYSRALMHVAGFEAPGLQHEIRDGAGLIGYTDYYWEGVRVAGEFDGVEKYMKPEYLKGRTRSQAVVDEKCREDRIRATGRAVVRWVWADLMTPGRLERKLAAAGVPRRRARSAR